MTAKFESIIKVIVGVFCVLTAIVCVYLKTPWGYPVSLFILGIFALDGAA